MKSLPIRLVVMAALAVALAAPAAAQDYLFGVPKLDMQVTVQPDASVRIVYDITFKNDWNADPIDVVDIGVPHKDYDLENIRASIDGTELGDIRHSAYVSPGFEVHLGDGAIGRGGTGTLHVEFSMPDMVYQDTTREDYASLRITPTWFGDEYVTGNTHINVAVHLPAGVKPEEALHQGTPFSQKVLFENGTSVVWQWPAERLTGPHMVAVSFPQRGLQRVVKVTRLGLFLKWFRESTPVRVVAGIVFLVLFGILFFRFTGGTGMTVYVVLSAVAVFTFCLSPGLHLLSLPIVAVLVGVHEWYLRYRKVSYMPPIAEVEGGGIKRGLTAPEAAVLLELPLGRVLGLVIFGMLKKGLLHQVGAEPLVVAVDEAFLLRKEELFESRKEQARFYRNAGQKQGVVAHKYEHGFLWLLEKNPGKPVRELNFAVPMKRLIERVVARMKGFDVSDTKEYYQSIIRRAVRQASSIGDIAQREKAIDRDFEWILVDDDYPTVFTTGHPYRPIWTRGPALPSAGPSPAPGIPGQTSFGDVSASFAGWAENTMGNMASAIAPGSLNLPKPAGGFLDLSGVDRVTGEFFDSLASSSGGGGGGGGCACACAGCACACACAGGGR